MFDRSWLAWSVSPGGVFDAGDQGPSRLLSIAAGSAGELGYQLLLAHDLEYSPGDAHSQLSDQVAEVKRMLYRLMLSLTPTG